jgi:hypothetical protein
MFVWVNTQDAGWVVHGTARSSYARAVVVADLLQRKLGWQTAAGSRPAPCLAKPDAPVARDAMRSPVTVPKNDNPAFGRLRP